LGSDFSTLALSESTTYNPTSIAKSLHSRQIQELTEEQIGEFKHIQEQEFSAFSECWPARDRAATFEVA
jgi:hypothetical protein